MIHSAEYLKLLIALIAIIDVPGNVPMFLQQTAQFSSMERIVTAIAAATATCLILLVFAFFGEMVLSTFGITIAAFKVLGGIVVLLIALDMLGLMGDSQDPADSAPSKHAAVSIGIFPLAIPLFAGPGAITVVMVYAHKEFHSHHDLIVILVVVSASIILCASLLLAGLLGHFIGRIAQMVLNRILGMIVGALGAEFILEGLAEFFPRLVWAPGT